MEHYKVSHFGEDICNCGRDWPCHESITGKLESDKKADQAEDTASSNTEHQELMEMLGGIFVQLSRVYDVLMINLSSVQRDQIDTMHQNGELMGSPPTLKEDAWD